MAIENGKITVNEIIVAQASGSMSIGLDLPVGSLALVQDGSGFHYKRGPTVTEWNSAVLVDASGNFTTYVNDPSVAPFNVKFVQKTPASGQYASIYDAVQSISDASPSNPYMVYVYPGVYSEPEITVGSGINIVGSDEYSVYVEPSGANNVFNLENLSTLAFLIIQNVPSGFYGTTIYDPGDFVLAHKISYADTYTAMIIKSNTGSSGNFVFLEYVDTTQDSLNGVGFEFLAASGSSLNVSAENFYVIGGDTNPDFGIIASGQGLELVFRAAELIGTDNTGVGIEIMDGANVLMPVLGLRNWASGAHVSTYGNPSQLRMFSTALDNDINISIEHSGASGFLSSYSPYEKNIINSASSFFINNKDQRIITVSKNGGDFTSVAQAIGVISGASQTNQYVVSVGPGVFFEPNPIALKPYVTVRGQNALSSTIYATTPGAHLFSGISNASISDLTLAGTTASGSYLLNWDNLTDNGRLTMFGCQFGPTYGVAQLTPHNDNKIYFAGFNLVGLPLSNIQEAFTIHKDPALTSLQNTIHIQDSLFSDTYTGLRRFAVVHGSGSFLQVDNTIIQNQTPFVSGTTGFTIYDGAEVRLLNLTTNGFQTAIYNPDIGQPISIFGGSINLLNNGSDISLLHSTSVGNILGTFSRVKTNITSDLITVLSSDPTDFSTISIGNFYTGPSTHELVEISQLWRESSTMGLMNGGVLSGSVFSLNLSVASGAGYIDTDGNGLLSKLTWSGTTTLLSANSDSYIFINNLGNVATSASPINGQTDKILLGRTVTTSFGVLYVEDTYMDSVHFSNKADKYLREVFGGIVSNGLLISNSGLNVSSTAGEYFFSSHNWKPSEKEPIPQLLEFYHLSGNWIASFNFSGVVNNVNFDNGTNLSGLSTGYYTKHSLYYNGPADTHMFVYGQVEYSGLESAQKGPSPTSSDSFRDTVIPVADIIVQQGSGSIIDVIDTRPLPSYKASSSVGGSGVTYHNQLLGLLNDDHTQYLLTNGSRSMGGNLNMGSSDITNVGLVGGIVPSGHSSRHLPNGADAITTAAPTTNLATNSTNDAGVQNSLSRSDHSHAFDLGTPTTVGTVNSAGSATTFVRSDHVHAHGNQLGGSLHSGADNDTTGFLTSGSFVSFTNKVNSSGDTMTGTLNAPVLSGTTISGNSIFLLGNPVIVSGVNLSVGNSVFAQKNTNNLEFKSLFAGSSISLLSTSSGITIASTADAIDAPSSTTDNAVATWSGTGGLGLRNTSVIISNNGITLNSSVISGTTISGNTIFASEISGVNARGYVFTYDTTTQSVAVANTFQGVTFNNTPLKSSWTHTSGTDTFTCGIDGLYQAIYTASVRKNGGPALNLEIRNTLNGTEIAGSQSYATLSSNNAPQVISNSFIFSATAGNTFSTQVTATSANGQLISGGPNAATQPSIRLTIHKL